MISDLKLNNWYVYKHTREDKNEIFYIGIGCSKNFKRAYEKYKRNNIWYKITNKTSFSVEILNENLSKEEASIMEINLIKEIGRIDLGTGTLSNMTNGGDGTNQFIFTDEQREKISEKMSGKNNHRYGKKQSKEVIEKRISKLRGKEKSIETKSKQSLSSVESGQAKTTLVYKYSDGSFIGEYHSLSEACRKLDILKRNSHAVQVSKGERKQCCGYVFIYRNNSDKIEDVIIIDKSHKKATPERIEKMRDKNCKSILQMDYEGNIIKIWKSAREASRFLKISASHIGSVCKDSRKSAGGFKWKFNK